MSIPRSRLVAVLATAAVIPAAAVASGVASAQSGDTTTTTQSSRPQGARGPGNDTATLDEPALYARVLSAAEVLDHYKLGTGTG